MKIFELNSQDFWCQIHEGIDDTYFNVDWGDHVVNEWHETPATLQDAYQMVAKILICASYNWDFTIDQVQFQIDHQAGLHHDSSERVPDLP